MTLYVNGDLIASGEFATRNDWAGGEQPGSELGKESNTQRYNSTGLFNGGAVASYPETNITLNLYDLNTNRFPDNTLENILVASGPAIATPTWAALAGVAWLALTIRRRRRRGSNPPCPDTDNPLAVVRGKGFLLGEGSGIHIIRTFTRQHPTDSHVLFTGRTYTQVVAVFSRRTVMLRRTMLGITGLVLLLGQVSAQGQATATVAAQVNQQVPEIIKLVGEAKAYDDAAGKARALFDYVVAFNPSRDTASFVEAAYVDRLTRQLVKAQPAVRDKAAAILLKYPDLARALVFTAQPADKPEQFLPVLVKLHDAHGQKIGKYPALTAALCLVHDQPLEIHINENLVKAPDPVALFDFYMTHRRKMLFGLTRVPTELMVWIVDSTATIKDMQWAVDNYAGDREVGARFFDIEYDYDHLRRGTPKKVTQKGFSLPNICKYGGVCADQAYFAAAVGKSIGVPTAYVTGRSGTVGHAWVGFVQAQGRKGVWNFDKGRYPEYQAVRGVVYHPQTRQMVSDSYVALLAELIGTPDAQRYTAIAMTDAVMRLRELAKDGQVNVPYVGAAEGDGRPPMVRSASAEDQLALLETGLRACPGYANAWYAVSALANEKKLSMGQIRTWAAMVQRLTGQKYPDFTMDILKPMIAAVNSPIDQNALWDSAFRFVQRRTDLAAEVRLAQGLLWEAEGEIRKAGKCYEDVINRYVNAGPFVLTALEKTAAMLTESGKTEKIVMLYATTWKRTEKPSSMAGVFMEQSNWYQIGKAYAQQLRAAGNAAEAAKVEKQISS